MKNSVKTLFAAILVIFTASCQKDENRNKPGTGEPRTITATLANNDHLTKTHLGGEDGKKTLWSEGDTIWISDGTNSAKIQLIKGAGEPEEGYIKGNLAANEKSFTFTVPSEITGTVYAVYPAFAQDGIDGGNIQIKIPTFQSGKFGDANISVAKESDNVLQFKNATAVVKVVHSPSSEENDIEIYLSSNTQLAGKVSVTYGESLTVTANNPEMTGIGGLCEDGDTANYLAVVPAVATNIVVRTEGKDGYKQKTASSKKLEVNKVYRLDATDWVQTAYETYSGANCHIIPGGGYYTIDVQYKGNSTEQVGEIDDIEVLWESFGTATAPKVGEIIAMSEYVGTGSVVIVTTGNEGNAVIAAKDASGNILWSWHIWVCSGYDPEATKQEYNNSAGFMMDRNLGATSATKGSVKSLGLLYQWGRKDPFLSGNDVSSSTQAASTLTWPSAEAASSHLSGNNTLAYSIKNPTTYIKKNDNNYGDWYCMDSQYKNDTLWKISAGKTIYDPCPVGYRVPNGGKIADNGVWTKAFNTDDRFTESTGFSNGFDFGATTNKLVSSGTCWYPAAGVLNYTDGSLKYVSTQGYYWSCTPGSSGFLYEQKADNFYFTSSYYVYPLSPGWRSFGNSVRCIKEQ